MELTATNRPRAWPGALEDRKVEGWKRRQDGKTDCRESNSPTMEEEGKHVCRTDERRVCGFEGIWNWQRKSDRRFRKGLGRTGLDNAGFLKYGQDRQIMKM